MDFRGDLGKSPFLAKLGAKGVLIMPSDRVSNSSLSLGVMACYRLRGIVGELEGRLLLYAYYHRGFTVQEFFRGSGASSEGHARYEMRKLRERGLIRTRTRKDHSTGMTYYISKKGVRFVEGELFPALRAAYNHLLESIEGDRYFYLRGEEDRFGF